MSRWHRYKFSTGTARKRTRGSTYHDLPSANSLKYLFVYRVRVTLLDQNITLDTGHFYAQPGSHIVQNCAASTILGRHSCV